MDKGIEKKDITRPANPRNAKGRPGAKPRWTSGAKTIVGTAVPPTSRIWYTINNGTLAEIYFHDVDQANTRSVRFLISDGRSFFSDEMWDAEHKVEWLEVGVPACRIESHCKAGRYSLTKEIVPDPVRDTLLLRGQFIPSVQDDSQTGSQTEQNDLKLYLIIDAHIGDRGAGNDAWAGQYKGYPMVFAQRESLAMACAAAPPFLQASVGYMGTSDGFTFLRAHKPLPGSNLALNGNVVMTVEVDYRGSGDGSFLLALAGGADAAEAGQQARAGILGDFGRTRAAFLQQWQERQAGYRDLNDLSGHSLDMYRVSTAVLDTHQSKRFAGGFIASLSLPWGFARGDKDVGGYHVVWPRDLVETALSKLASGDAQTARSALFFLACTQDAEGCWSQNMWLDGTPHWTARQMDAIALPILLADKLRRDKALGDFDPRCMIEKAARFLVRYGPVTEQDRWENTPGYSPFTMATQVAALLAAADFIEESGSPDRAEFLRDTADAWNEAIDELTYVEDTPLARKHGLRGYYVRMTPPRRIETRETGHLRIVMPTVPHGPKSRRAIDITSPGALALVRFGLRAPGDPRILDTVKLLDATLRREMATGPGWKRSTDDGYGEKADGRPFDGTGIGRCWPLLAGERGHYELAAGRRQAALDLLKTMARQTSECGMIPEQVWDGPDIPQRFLANGYPTGSGMPLAWAHSEYIKLLRSLHDGEVWDRVPQTVERYLHQHRTAAFQIWTPRQRRGWLTAGKDLRIDLPTPGNIRWQTGRTKGEINTIDSGFHLHYAMLETHDLPPESSLRVVIEPEKTKHGQRQKADSFIIRARG